MIRASSALGFVLVLFIGVFRIVPLFNDAFNQLVSVFLLFEGVVG